jgi:hypothetical protein
MTKIDRFLVVTIFAVLLVPLVIFGTNVQACCGVTVDYLQVTDAPDPVCAGKPVTISGSYYVYTTWGDWTELYNTGVEIRIFDSGMTMVDEYNETLGTAEPNPGTDPGTEWIFSHNWTPTVGGDYTYVVVVWSETGYGRMQISFVDGTITVPDADGDGICDDEDNCPYVANPGQEDGDADGLGDVCDGCPADPENDADADGVCGDVDNCRYTYNPDQADFDGDLVGDACDNCPYVYNPLQMTWDECPTIDVCLETEIRLRWEGDCKACEDETLKNHGEYVSCRANIVSEYVEAGLVDEEGSSCLINPEARSDCGKKK